MMMDPGPSSDVVEQVAAPVSLGKRVLLLEEKEPVMQQAHPVGEGMNKGMQDGSDVGPSAVLDEEEKNLNNFVTTPHASKPHVSENSDKMEMHVPEHAHALAHAAGINNETDGNDDDTALALNSHQTNAEQQCDDDREQQPSPSPPPPPPPPKRPYPGTPPDEWMPRLIARANAEGCVWHKVKGYPYWPCQRVPNTAVEETPEKFAHVPKRYAKQDTLIQYFGTHEYLWVPGKELTPFSDGVAKKFHSKCKLKSFRMGLREIERYLGVEIGVDDADADADTPTGEIVDRIHPYAWFDAPPEPESESEDEEEEEKDDTKSARRPAKLARYTGPIWFDHWKPNCDDAAQDFELPYYILNARQPRYDHLRRNMYMPDIAPVRLPRDEVNVCSCCLPKAAARQEQARRAISAPTPKNVVIPALPTARQSARNAAAAAAAAADEVAECSMDACVEIQNNAVDGASAAAAAAGQKRLRLCCSNTCENYALRMFCDPRRCPAGRFCANVPFSMRVSSRGGGNNGGEGGSVGSVEEFVPDLPPVPKLRPFLTERRGWGLKTMAPIAKGSFVIEYVGEVITDRECESRLWACKASGETNYYLMQLGAGRIIDARLKGNFSRLINSSCDPNCETQKWTDAASDETRVGIFALRDIAANEELSYDYCFQHFGTTASHSFRCECGAANCRGALDASKATAKFK